MESKIKDAYVELAKADKTKENGETKRANALENFHAVFIGANVDDVWDEFSRMNDFKREVPLMADGKPVIGKNGKPRFVRVGNVEPTASARVAISTMRKVYSVDENISVDWKECRKRYNAIRTAEQSDDAIVEKHVKAFMKLPPRLRAAIQKAQKDAMMAEASTEQAAAAA